MTFADWINLLFCFAAIVVPRAAQRTTARANSIIIIGGMFLFALLGGLTYKMMTDQSGISAFSRIFFVSGISHLIIYAAYQEIYRRLEIRQMQIDHQLKQTQEE